ncbi:hypothetical protein [Halorussus halobius]|uniref:hypothetical protein n=1 Tax=Halorussus halobius TaxID=1710537 RepID=UPI001092553A|nr:hypothetical protein [Halorussus halobius]
MTDFTETLNTTGASVEDLTEDLEAHLSDTLGTDVELQKSSLVVVDNSVALDVDVELPGLKEEIAERLGADIVHDRVKLSVGLDGDLE